MYGSGLNNGSTEVAHLHLKSILEYASYNNLSSSTIFVDISTAFATMCKEIALEDIQDNQHFVQICTNLTIPIPIWQLLICYFRHQSGDTAAQS